MEKPVFYPAEILLPKEGTNLGLWATLACDQFTSQPEYWKNAEQLVGEAPSTLKMVLPEVYLEENNVEDRISAIHSTMNEYEKIVLTEKVNGFVYIERTCQSGLVRQGLLGCVDLEEYSFEKGAQVRIRPSENTVVDRIPPRLAVRRQAGLEAPHILMLMDDAEESVIEPISQYKNQLPLLYDQELMLGGGRIQGWAVTRPEDINTITKAINGLDNPEKFHDKYGTTENSACFVFAVGDGNHSLATAKAAWEEVKAELSAEEQKNHPARFCLVELENVQSPAIEIEPIHRVVFEADGPCMLHSFALFASTVGAKICRNSCENGGQSVSILDDEEKVDLCIQNSPSPLAAGTVEDFLAYYEEDHPEMRVDYVHGEKAVEDLVAKGAVGILLPPFEKSDLFRGVALGGVLPKKTFSMGHAEEKRYYLECRKIKAE